MGFYSYLKASMGCKSYVEEDFSLPGDGMGKEETIRFPLELKMGGSPSVAESARGGKVFRYILNNLFFCKSDDKL